MTNTTTKRKATDRRPKPKADRERCPMKVGKYYSFQFPRHNFHGVLSPMESRQFRCDAIRDLVKEPLDRLANELQPLLRRGRFLVTGWDLDKQLERSFYVEPMKQIVEIEPPPNDRTELTVYVVTGLAFFEEKAALAAAQTAASRKKQPVPIEVIRISRTLPRNVLRIVEPSKRATTAMKSPGRRKSRASQSA